MSATIIRFPTAAPAVARASEVRREAQFQAGWDREQDRQRRRERLEALGAAVEAMGLTAEGLEILRKFAHPAKSEPPS